MADESREALRRVEERLGEASARAERMMDEARRAAEAPKPPPSGWQAPEQPSSLTGELEAVVNAIRSLRDLIPPEVVARLADALRELLLALRALIDLYLERLEHGTPEAPKVEDIPIQ